MVVQLSGVIHGRSIELERDVGLPDGCEVRVRIESQRLSLEERRKRVRALCGAWRTDETLEEIFAAISRERLQRGQRTVSVDDPS